tara:strand:+ start:285 stop:452 length:168 start_codon:yes stop_codon:yes gene_type:complete
MSINKLPSKEFQKFTKKLHNLDGYTDQERRIIYDKWQKEHHNYLKNKYNFKKIKS